MNLNDILKQAQMEAAEVAAEREGFRRRTYLKEHLHLIQLSAMGVSRKEMAHAYKRSLRTIEQQFDKLYEILGCNSAAHLVGRAFMLGLLEVRDGKIITNQLPIQYEF